MIFENGLPSPLIIGKTLEMQDGALLDNGLHKEMRKDFFKGLITQPNIMP